MVDLSVKPQRADDVNKNEAPVLFKIGPTRIYSEGAVTGPIVATSIEKTEKMPDGTQQTFQFKSKVGPFQSHFLVHTQKPDGTYAGSRSMNQEERVGFLTNVVNDMKTQKKIFDPIADPVTGPMVGELCKRAGVSFEVLSNRLQEIEGGAKRKATI